MASMHSLDYDGGYEVPSNELLLPKINQSQDPWVQRKSRYFLIFKYCLCALLGFLGGVYLQYSRSSSCMLNRYSRSYAQHIFIDDYVCSRNFCEDLPTEHHVHRSAIAGDGRGLEGTCTM